MAILLNDNLKINAGKPVDSRYLNGTLAYVSESEVNSIINISERYIGLTVRVNEFEYWYSTGVTDIDLVEKLGGSSGGLSNSTVLTMWGNIENGLYYEDFEHNLNTKDIIWSLTNTVGDFSVLPDIAEIIDVNTIRIYISTNNKSLRLVITAHGGTQPIITGDKYITTISSIIPDNTLTITHNLNDTDILFQIWDNTSGEIIHPLVNNRQLNTVDMTFVNTAPLGDVRIVIKK